MTFRAIIRRGSTVYRRWVDELRTGGKISGVWFAKRGEDFVADEIPPGALEKLQTLSWVQVEMVTEPVGNATVVEDPAPEPKAARNPDELSLKLGPVRGRWKGR